MISEIKAHVFTFSAVRDGFLWDCPLVITRDTSSTEVGIFCTYFCVVSLISKYLEVPRGKNIITFNYTTLDVAGSS